VTGLPLPLDSRASHEHNARHALGETTRGRSAASNLINNGISPRRSGANLGEASARLRATRARRDEPSSTLKKG
jgi:hypothetical protein